MKSLISYNYTNRDLSLAVQILRDYYLSLNILCCRYALYTSTLAPSCPRHYPWHGLGIYLLPWILLIYSGPHYFSTTLSTSVAYDTLSPPLDRGLLEGRASASHLSLYCLFAKDSADHTRLLDQTGEKTHALFYHSWWCRSVPSWLCLSLVRVLSVHSRNLWTKAEWWGDTGPQQKGRSGLSSQVDAPRRLHISPLPRSYPLRALPTHPPTHLHTHTHAHTHTHMWGSRAAWRLGPRDADYKYLRWAQLSWGSFLRYSLPRTVGVPGALSNLRKRKRKIIKHWEHRFRLYCLGLGLNLPFS